jgi:hypothetical protein
MPTVNCFFCIGLPRYPKRYSDFPIPEIKKPQSSLNSSIWIESQVMLLCSLFMGHCRIMAKAARSRGPKWLALSEKSRIMT